MERRMNRMMPFAFASGRCTTTPMFSRIVAVLLLSICFIGTARADAARQLRVFPDSITLHTARDYQSLVVQIIEPDGVTRDVTHEAKFTAADPSLITLDVNVVRPVADGQTQITVEAAGMSVTAPVTIVDAQKDRPISFRLDVMPVFMRTGCNGGACHGAARGKDGFQLSLFGYDPEGDYYRLTREIAARRINLALPRESLLIEKSVGKVPHTGGIRFQTGDEYEQTLVRWLEAGAPKDSPDVAEPIALEIMPDRLVLEGTGTTQRMTVRAKYSDGTDRDVTSLALFLSSNDNSATIDGNGVVTAGQRGEAFIMARFATFTVGSHAIVIPEGTSSEYPEQPANNYIDELINAKLRKMRIVPSELADDAVFLRRIYIDVIGQLPTEEEYQRFMSDTSPDKREKLIDELLNRKEFVEMWVMKWAELLQIRSSPQVSYKAALLYYNFLQERIANNTPFDQIVRELLSASGGTFTEPATNYYQITNDTLLIAENTAQVFMGMRLQCAQCHNHPFDRWTMDDYYGFAAFFGQIGRKSAEDPRETIVFNRGGGEVNHPVTKQPVAPRFLGGAVADVRGKDRREVLANWLASPENPYFARNLANIVWAHFMGRGIIEPVDDVRISNPPSNAELLDELGRRFTEYNYDFKRLVRDICMSRAYQRSTRANETNALDDRNFSRAAIRRVRAEVLLDMITQVTETRNKFRGLPLGARAVQIADGSTTNYFLTTFGRAKRETVCSCEVSMEPNLSQALHLLNGDTVNQKLREGQVVKKLLDAGKSPQEVIETLYLRTLSRPPTETEMTRLLETVNAEDNKQAVLDDVFWALLNSKEFLFNH